MITDTLKTIDKLYQRKEMITGVPTGYQDLDKITAGLQPSDLIIVAGRPGMGKTAFALNIAANAAYSGVGAAIFSWKCPKSSWCCACFARSAGEQLQSALGLFGRA